MPIIIDYSQVALSNIFQFQSDLKKNANNPEAINIIRHAILTGLKSYKVKYGAEYGDMIISCDGKNYWRRDIFPHYKAQRKSNREKSDLDWKLVFDTMSQISDDLAKYFPYKVLRLDKIESDDIIALICKWTQTNGFVENALVEEKQKVIIISSDHDFKQLHAYDNVKQWSPMQKLVVRCDNPKKYLAEHIATGDSGDGIPNVLSNDEVLITEGVRQNRMTSKRREEFILNGRDACKTDTERRNWDRNRNLIDFNYIPEDIQRTIIDKFENVEVNKNKQDVFNYLIQNKCRLLLNDLEQFF